MEPTKQDAEAMLKDAGEIQSAVRARTPQEHPLYFAMGLAIRVLRAVLRSRRRQRQRRLRRYRWPCSWWSLLAVMVGTHVPYLRRYRQVRMRSTPMWLAWALAAWAAAALFLLGILLDGTIGFAFTLGGILGAAPFLLWAERLRSTA